jgi:precorrin-3B synthase
LGDAAQFDCGLIAGGIMTGFMVKGWCPSALRPMASGDGLVVRVRPRGGRLTPAQASGIAELAKAFGNGLIDLTGRANLQIRGVREIDSDALAAALDRLGLVDREAELEAQRNILVTPFWAVGDDTHLLAMELERALAGTPLGLPDKFGFAVDCGESRVLAHAPADVRIERGAQGGLIVRAEGAAEGRAVAREQAVPTALALANWFVTTGGANNGRGRMAAHIASGIRLPHALAGVARPAPAMAAPSPYIHPAGALVALVFGQLQSETLGFLARLAPGLRMTPWRMVLVEDCREMPQHEGLITRADDPLLRVTACTGAPGCPEARVETRKLAAALAAGLSKGSHLHVSGCAKGCAHPGPANITLVGTSDGLDLVRDGGARDVPSLRGLDPATILAEAGTLVGAR